MKTQINRERLFDPRLRAFVARREYVEAIRYYRNQYQSDRAEATEAIDFVREQLERERDSGAAPPTIEAWSHAPVTPQEPATNIRFEAPPPEKLSEEEEEEQSEFSAEAPEETTEEYDDPDENLNSSPYELPGTFGRPELERVYQQEKTAKQLDETDSEEESEEYEDDEDDLFDEDEEVEEIEDEEEEEPEVEAEAPSIEHEDEEPVVPSVIEAPIEEKPASVPLPEPVLPPEPVVVQPPRAPLELPKMVVSVPEEPPSGIPSWESLSSSLRREILSLEQQEAIRLYWSEAGCSLSEAKAYVSYWRATKG
jgi:hypothetical protein